LRRRARKKTPKEKKQQLSYFSSPRQQALDMKLFLNTNYTTFNRKHVVAVVLAFVFIFTPVITVLALTDQERAVLEAELKVLEAEIAEKEKLLSQQKQQTGSISRDVSILTNQIEQAKLSIKAKNLQINKISEEIGNKEEVIETLDEKIEREKESLAQLLRKTNEINDTSLIHIILSNESLSEFYVDLDSFQSIKEDIRASVAEIEQVQGITAEEKKALEEKKNSELDTKASLEDSKKKVELNEQEKKRLLSVSKGKESEYRQFLQTDKREQHQYVQRSFNFVILVLSHLVMHSHMRRKLKQKLAFVQRSYLQF
jgi:septal ring factor EnvC (AmiA/AmiB activator)